MKVAIVLTLSILVAVFVVYSCSGDTPLDKTPIYVNPPTEVNVSEEIEEDFVEVFDNTTVVEDINDSVIEENKSVAPIIVAPIVVPAPESPYVTHAGVKYETVISPYTGREWLDRNLGASQVCRVLNDKSCYGNYYQFGRGVDGHQKSQSTTTAKLAHGMGYKGNQFIVDHDDWMMSDKDGSLRSAAWASTEGKSVCPKGFRVPTIGEIRLETVDSSDGVHNNKDAFKNFLKLPSAGYRSRNGHIHFKGSSGMIWSSNVKGNNSSYLYFYSLNAETLAFSRENGVNIRCIKD